MKQSLTHAILHQLNLSNSQPQDRSIWQTFNLKEWEQALNWMDTSGLALYFLNRVQAANAADLLPESVRTRLMRGHTENRARVSLMAEELRMLCQLLGGAGIDFLLLKGFALVPDYCPDPSLRSQYDHDLLIHPSSIEQAEEALLKAGYHRKQSDETYHLIYIQAPHEVPPHLGPLGIYSINLTRPVELHIRLWDPGEEKIDIKLPEDAFFRAAHRRLGELEYFALADENSLAFQALHAFRHILRSWCRLSTFLEIAQFLNNRRGDAFFWRSFADRISNQQWLPEICGIVFTLSASLFGAEIPEVIEPQTVSALSPRMRLWITRYGRQSALTNFHTDKYGLFLHREFVRAPSDWSEVRRRRLFPMHRPHRTPAVFHPGNSSSAKTFLLQCVHGIRRLKFHISSDFRYAWDVPRWHFRRWKMSSEPRACFAEPPHIELKKTTTIEGH